MSIDRLLTNIYYGLLFNYKKTMAYHGSMISINRDAISGIEGSTKSILLYILTNCADLPDMSDNVKHGIPISLQIGQIVTTLKEIEIQTGMSKSNVRTSLSNLVKLKIITDNNLKNRARLITVQKPEHYFN